MRVIARRLPRSPESFPTLFRSILVAAFAAEGCADLVTTPDAATPDVAPTDATVGDVNVIPR